MDVVPALALIPEHATNAVADVAANVRLEQVANLRAGRGLADEGDGLDGRMLGQRLAGFLAEAVHGVEHAVGQTRLLGELRQQIGRHRRPFRRLVHHPHPTATPTKCRLDDQGKSDLRREFASLGAAFDRDFERGGYTPAD